ncbi:hypothetical protein PLESTB_001804300 [Pleodorina starrii]|uniref:Uncharacterized protein n=1 Tax=Pleodorina starrii TaxID=330485 RepID=A0A9W6FA00_9CHLO|nr:hypothetical protein PLESTB_001804300 [Pleodorina starrii]
MASVTIEQVRDVLSEALAPIRADLKMLSCKKVPLRNGSLPTGEYPRTIMELTVAGNDALPDGSNNPWNKARTINLLRQYDEEYEEDSGNESGDEDEQSPKSRTRRLRLARCLGITPAQLNFAQLTL